MKNFIMQNGIVILTMATVVGTAVGFLAWCLGSTEFRV